MTHKYYILEDHTYDPQDTLRIVLQEGPYDGIVYHYVEAGFKDRRPPTLKFSYNIDFTPEILRVDLEKDESFIQTIGDILVEVFEETFNENRDNNSQQSDL